MRLLRCGFRVGLGGFFGLRRAFGGFGYGICPLGAALGFLGLHGALVCVGSEQNESAGGKNNCDCEDVFNHNLKLS